MRKNGGADGVMNDDGVTTAFMRRRECEWRRECRGRREQGGLWEGRTEGRRRRRRGGAARQCEGEK